MWVWCRGWAAWQRDVDGEAQGGKGARKAYFQDPSNGRPGPGPLSGWLLRGYPFFLYTVPVFGGAPPRAGAGAGVGYMYRVNKHNLIGMHSMRGSAAFLAG